MSCLFKTNMRLTVSWILTWLNYSQIDTINVSSKKLRMAFKRKKFGAAEAHAVSLGKDSMKTESEDVRNFFVGLTTTLSPSRLETLESKPFKNRRQALTRLKQFGVTASGLQTISDMKCRPSAKGFIDCDDADMETVREALTKIGVKKEVMQRAFDRIVSTIFFVYNFYRNLMVWFSTRTCVFTAIYFTIFVQLKQIFGNVYIYVISSNVLGLAVLTDDIWAGSIHFQLHLKPENISFLVGSLRKHATNVVEEKVDTLVEEKFEHDFGRLTDVDEFVKK